MSTCWAPSVMSVLMTLLHRQGQPDRDCHAAVDPLAAHLDRAVVGGHEGVGDPEAQAETRSHLGVTMTTEKLLSEQRPVVGIEASPLIGDRNCEVAGFALPAHHDR